MIDGNRNETRFLVDTNILVYSLDNREPTKKEISGEFLENRLSKPGFFISAQNLGEMYYVLTEKIPNPISRTHAKQTVQTYARPTQVIFYSLLTLESAMGLAELHHLHFWDALLAATMLENNVRIIYTENTKDFNKIPGITAINPFKTKQAKVESK